VVPYHLNDFMFSIRLYFSDGTGNIIVGLQAEN